MTYLQRAATHQRHPKGRLWLHHTRLLPLKKECHVRGRRAERASFISHRLTLLLASPVAVEDRAATEGIQLLEGLGREGGGLRGKTKKQGARRGWSGRMERLRRMRTGQRLARLRCSRGGHEWLQAPRSASLPLASSCPPLTDPWHLRTVGPIPAPGSRWVHRGVMEVRELWAAFGEAQWEADL